MRLTFTNEKAEIVEWYFEAKGIVAAHDLLPPDSGSKVEFVSGSRLKVDQSAAKVWRMRDEELRGARMTATEACNDGPKPEADEKARTQEAPSGEIKAKCIRCGHEYADELKIGHPCTAYTPGAYVTIAGIRMCGGDVYRIEAFKNDHIGKPTEKIAGDHIADASKKGDKECGSEWFWCERCHCFGGPPKVSAGDIHDGCGGTWLPKPTEKSRRAQQIEKSIERLCDARPDFIRDMPELPPMPGFLNKWEGVLYFQIPGLKFRIDAQGLRQPERRELFGRFCTNIFWELRNGEHATLEQAAFDGKMCVAWCNWTRKYGIGGKEQ